MRLKHHVSKYEGNWAVFLSRSSRRPVFITNSPEGQLRCLEWIGAKIATAKRRIRHQQMGVDPDRVVYHEPIIGDFS